MRQAARVLFFCAAFLAGASSIAAPNDTDTAKYITERIAVGGVVVHALTLTVDDLRKLPQHEIGEVPMIHQSGAVTGKLNHLRGVLLRDILEQAVLVTHDHNDVKKMIIVATASDGYKAIFSWSELFNSPLADGVLVYYEKDGLPLADNEGRIAMIASNDLRTGPRHVKWLQSIEVRQITE
jgi:DMSO/TMAO reductase YedYZ molybdopterin-dependent catalytic subunit